MVELVVGIDGGATKTKCIVVDRETGYAWIGTSGPSNPVNIGVIESGRAIRECIETALRGTGYRISNIVKGVAGIAGLDSLLVKKETERYIKEASNLFDKLSIEHDAHIALMHATMGEPGVIVIAGTGSIAYAYTRSGRRIIVGNRGWFLGDEGSSFWIAQSALRRLNKVLDGRMDSNCLVETLAKRMGISSSDELMYWFYKSRNRVEKLALPAKYVLDAADSGCPHAIELVCKGAYELASITSTALRLSRQNKVFITGTLFKNKTYLGCFREKLEYTTGAELVQQQILPVLGALLLALGPRYSYLLRERKIIELAKNLYY